MSSQSGSASITVADKVALRARTPQPTSEIALTNVQYSYRVDQGEAAITSVVLSGLAWGVSPIAVSVSSPASTAIATGQATVDSSGEWNVTLDVSSRSVAYGSSITIGMQESAPATSHAQAANTLVLGVPAAFGSELKEADGHSAGFEPERNFYVGGHPDRFVVTRSYIPLICSYFVLPPGVVWQPQPGYVKLEPDQLAAFQKELATNAARAGHDFMSNAGKSGRVNIQQAYETLGKTYEHTVGLFRQMSAKASPDKSVQTPHRSGYKVDALSGIQFLKIVPPPIHTDLKSASVDAAQSQLLLKDSIGMDQTIFGQQVGVVTGLGWIRYINLGWLGIMFSDRLRFRASGLAAGEQVFSLGLAPGEEVTLTQNSETKRSRSFEEVLDQDQEKSLTFSSTWSTNFTQQDVASDTFSFGENLGANLGLPASQAVSAGGTAGVNAQQSSTESATRQRARAIQATSTYSSKAREEHKTTFKVGIEGTESFGSKRVLRNPNPSRALMLHFHKLYQKYRVLLERNDAKLCCSFCLMDPGHDLRAELNDELDKLDPQVSLVPSANCPKIPVSDSFEDKKQFDGAPEYHDFDFTYTLPANTVLADNSLDNCFRLTKWIAADWTNQDGFERDLSKFRNSGGEWEYRGDPPQIGAPGIQSCTVRVTIPPTGTEGVLWWTKHIEVSFIWKYVPSAEITKEVQDCIDGERKKISDSFSVDKVLQILDDVGSGFRDNVLMRIQDQLYPNFDVDLMNAPCSMLDDIRNIFEWDELAIEYLPWWLTASGRENRESLRQRFLELPGDVQSRVAMKDWLVSSMVRVYLPVKPGHEKDVLWWTQLDDEPQHYLEQSLDDFVQWRQNQFGALPYTLPTYDEVLAIEAATATPTGSNGWFHDWEKPRNKFTVLDEWSELLPTDGVHIEPALSQDGSMDAYRTTSLLGELRASAAQDRLWDAKSEATRAAALRDNLTSTLEIKE
jgi:hypothetical protein